MNFLENRLKNAEDTLFQVQNDLDKLIKELENKPELFNIYLKVLKIRQTILERDSEVKTFIPTVWGWKMNIQIPFDLLGHYESIVLNTDNTFYQLTVRYQCANITITLNSYEIESYNFRYNFTNPTMDIERVKDVLPKLIEYFEKLGHKDTYGMREKWKI